jgi:hypothetical protein
VLTETLDVPSGVHLNCQGHRLIAPPVTVFRDANNQIIEIVDPRPLIALVIHDGTHTQITGCDIEGFDQGIYVIRTPAVAGDTDHWNQIEGNTINVKVKGITLWGAEDTLISNNNVTVASNQGAAIGIWRNTERNIITGNTVENKGAADPNEPTEEDFPSTHPERQEIIGQSPWGSPPSAFEIVSASGSAGLVQFILKSTSAVMSDTHCTGGHWTQELDANGNVVKDQNGHSVYVEDPCVGALTPRLFQFPWLTDTNGNVVGERGNVIDNNTVTASGPPVKKPSGPLIILNGPNKGTFVTRNHLSAHNVVQPTSGIAVNTTNLTAPVSLVSTCVGLPYVSCIADVDCNRLHYLQPDQPLDTCRCLNANGPCTYVATKDPTKVDYRTYDITVADNIVDGCHLSIGISANASQMTITGNQVRGASSGLQMGVSSIDPVLDSSGHPVLDSNGNLIPRTYVENNVLDANGVGLALATKPAIAAMVFTHNDITNATVPISVIAGWTATLNLDDGSEGNYWGPNGFVPPNSLIVDRYPYADPVAAPAPGSPPTCDAQTP